MFAGYMRDITERRRSEAALADYTRDLEVAHETQRQNSEQLATLVDRASRHAAAGRRRDQGQERLPRQHEPRAADAVERHHSLQRAPAGAGRRRRRRTGSRSPIFRRSSPRESTCSRSSTAFSTCRRSKPARWRSRWNLRRAGHDRRAARHRRTARATRTTTRSRCAAATTSER